MRFKFTKYILLFVFLLFVCSAASFAEDLQYWSTWSFAHDISDKQQVSALIEIYFKNNMKNDYVYDEYLSYSQKLDMGFAWQGQLYFEGAKASDDKWIMTRSLVAGLSYSKEISNICTVKLEDRFFYKINSPAGWDYHRPRIYLTKDLGKIKFILSDEIRIDLSGARADAFYRNRIYLTALLKASPSLQLGLGLLRQSDKVGADWQSFNGIQSFVNVNL